MKRFLLKIGPRYGSAPQRGKWTIPAIGGLVILAMTGLFAACPLPTSPSNLARSATPAVEEDDAVVAKTQREQAKVAFMLSTTTNGEWKVYGEAAGGSPLFDVEAEFAPPRLTLKHKTNVEAGVYWVTVTQPGRAESNRLKLKVKAFNEAGATETPETEAPRAVKAEEVQAAVDFTLTSSQTGEWKVYRAAADGRPLTGITASFSAPALTLRHASDVPAGAYWVTVQESGKAESGRLKLTVEAYTAAGATKTPAADITSVPKLSEFQSALAFALTTAHTGVWKVYDAASGGSPLGDIQALFSAPNKLTLLQTPDVPAGTYWVTVTESGKAESGRLKLTVEVYTPAGKTKMPTADVTGVPKTLPAQAAVEFTLTSTQDGDWKVYSGEYGGVSLTGINAAFDEPALTLSHASDIPAGDYWVSVTAAPLSESGRLKLTVIEYTLTAAPTADVTSVAMTQADQAAVVFTLTSTHTGEWKVYDAASGGSPRTDITAAFTAPALTLSAAPGVPAGTYWVTVQESGKAESERLKLIVEAYTPEGTSKTPTADVPRAIKSQPDQAAVEFTLTSTEVGQWKVYDAAGAPLTDIAASFDAPLLTLQKTGGVLAGAYWVTVTEDGLLESGRLKLTVLETTAITAVTAQGGVSALVDTGTIQIVFARALNTDLALSDISLAAGTSGEAALGAVAIDSGDASGASYRLTLASVTKEGDITLNFTHTEVSGSQTVGVFKNVNHSASHAAATVPGLYAGDMPAPVQELGNSNTGADLLGKAFTWIEEHARENGKYRIVLGADADQAAKDLDGAAFGNKTGVTITLAGDTAARTIQLTGTGQLFKVNSGTLRLGKYITLKGVQDNNPATGGALVAIETGGTLIMETDSVITGNTSTANGNYAGGGVRVLGNGVFTMNGGTISNNSHNNTGGVWVANPSGSTPPITGSPQFTMNGGTITENSGNYGGGVNLSHGGPFVMNGGSISNNTSTGGSEGQGGGIWVGSVTFTMKGGDIANNKALLGGGVFVNVGPFVMEGGTIKGNQATGTGASLGYGGGVNVRHTAAITKTGGIIYGDNAGTASDKNTAAETGKGGAVSVASRVTSSTPATMNVLKVLEHTVEASHNLTKTSADDAAEKLTPANGWQE